MKLDDFIDELRKSYPPQIMGKFDNESKTYVFPNLGGAYDISIFIENAGADIANIQITHCSQTVLTFNILEDYKDVYRGWEQSPEYNSKIEKGIRIILQ